MSSSALLPRMAGKFIAAHSKNVKISQEGILKTAKIIFDSVKKGDPVVDLKRWKTHQLNPKVMDEATLNWVFISDLLNFSFWSDAPELSAKDKKFMVKYGGKEWTGYWSWCACINRALDEGIPFTDPAYYSTITKEQLAHILRSDTAHPMPMFEERLKILQQAGQTLIKEYEGKFSSLVKAAEHNAQNLITLLVKAFPSFDDKATFEGQTVCLYKRVQILVADIWACFEGQSYGKFHDIDSITMFADYRIPQALVWLGAMEYSNILMEDLKNKKMFESGCEEEVEIRGCTIWAVELVVDEIKKMIDADTSVPQDTNVNAIIVDHYLWDYRREHAGETDHIPIHRTRSIYY